MIPCQEIHSDDDFLASWSAAGPTVEAFVKPEVLAPGGHMVSKMPEGSATALAHPEFQVHGDYYAMSGTSQAAAVVTGAVALLLFGVMTPEEAYRSMNWPVLFMIAAFVPVGHAFVTTGAAGAARGWREAAVLTQRDVALLLPTVDGNGVDGPARPGRPANPAARSAHATTAGATGRPAIDSAASAARIPLRYAGDAELEPGAAMAAEEEAPAED